MIEIYVGNTGQGKTYMTAYTALKLLERNSRWYEKGKIKQRRMVATNLALNAELKKEYPEQIIEWSDMEQLTQLRQCDVIFDDMSAYLDSQRWADTPMSVKRWLRLHEHYGCDIFGNAQDFKTIDPSVRRLTYSVYHVRKVLGSRRPSATKPRVRFIWGILFIRLVCDDLIDKETIKYEYQGLPKFYGIKKDVCQIFDTTQDLTIGEFPPLHHIERSCGVCGKVVAKHL